MGDHEDLPKMAGFALLLFVALPIFAAARDEVRQNPWVQEWVWYGALLLFASATGLAWHPKLKLDFRQHLALSLSALAMFAAVVVRAVNR